MLHEYSTGQRICYSQKVVRLYVRTWVAVLSQISNKYQVWNQVRSELVLNQCTVQNQFRLYFIPITYYIIPCHKTTNYPYTHPLLLCIPDITTNAPPTNSESRSKFTYNPYTCPHMCRLPKLHLNIIPQYFTSCIRSDVEQIKFIQSTA